MKKRTRAAKNVADYLNDGFSLVPKIWKEALAIGIVSTLPAAVLWILSFSAIGNVFAGFSYNADDDSSKALQFFSALLPLILPLLAASCLSLLGKTYQKAFICARTGEILEGQSGSVHGLAFRILKKSWWRVLLQDIVIGVVVYTLVSIVLSLILGGYILSKISQFASISEGDGAGSFIIQFLLIYFASLLVSAVIWWFIQVKTAVAAPASVLEHRNSMMGIGRALDLSSRRGWKIFAVLFVFSLVLSFGLAIVLGPVTFIAALPALLPFFKSLASGSSHPDISVLASLFSALGWAVGISYFLENIVKGSLWPGFLTILYSDLRSQSGEIRDLSLGSRRLKGNTRRRMLQGSGRAAASRQFISGEAVSEQ